MHHKTFYYSLGKDTFWWYDYFCLCDNQEVIQNLFRKKFI